jgi:hypothetical protein
MEQNKTLVGRTVGGRTEFLDKTGKRWCKFEDGTKAWGRTGAAAVGRLQALRASDPDGDYFLQPCLTSEENGVKFLELWGSGRNMYPDIEDVVVVRG